MEINELENKLRVCEDERTMAVKQCETTQQQNRQLSDEHHKEMTTTTLTTDDLKMKVSSCCNGRTTSDSIFCLLTVTQN